MKENNKYFEKISYINFTPLKLKVNKTDYFSIPNKLTNNTRHKSISLSYGQNITNHPLIKNPTHNFLYDKIDLNILSSSKYLLNKTIKNGKASNYDNYLTNNNNSKSVDYTIRKIQKKGKIKNWINNYYSINLNNSKNGNDTTYFSNKSKEPIKQIYIDNDMSFSNKYNHTIKLNSVSIYTDQNSNEERYKNKYFDKNYQKFENINKIILIQSYWRSYYLRKLVVGGLEKYYSSIAMSKYLNTILYHNKKYLFSYFIEAIKDYIINSKYSCFRYNNNKNNINIFYKNEVDENESFEIPLDKKNDCIYFFIKREQAKYNKNKLSDNKNLKSKNHEKLTDIYDYNWKNERKIRRIKKVTNNGINNEKCNKVNIKINLFNQNNNIDNKRSLKNKRFDSETALNNCKYRYKNNTTDFYDNNKPIKARLKKVYTKKKIGEEKKRINNNNIKIMVPPGINGGIGIGFNKNFNTNKESKKEIINKELNKEYINELINIIKKKCFCLYFPLLVKQLKLEISKIRDNFIKKSLFPKRNITYYKKKNNKYHYAKLKGKSAKTNGINKIKVNKNNQLKKHKFLKKLVEKKALLINKKNIISLTKYFLNWRNNFRSSIISFHLRDNKRINNSEEKDLNRYKMEKISPKKHIKCRFKKSLTNTQSLSLSKSEKKKISSLSCKKMKIERRYSEQKLPLSLLSNDIDLNCQRNLFVQMNKKEELYKKVISIIKKLENKNVEYKYFSFWKKEVKKK